MFTVLALLKTYVTVASWLLYSSSLVQRLLTTNFQSYHQLSGLISLKKENLYLQNEKKIIN